MELGAIAVALDLIAPLAPLGRSLAQHRIARLDEARNRGFSRAGNARRGSFAGTQRHGTHADSSAGALLFPTPARHLSRRGRAAPPPPWRARSVETRLH